MAFYSNSTQGTVVHTTNGFYDHGKILANDGSDFANTTLATVSELSIPLGGYERIMGVYNIWYDSDDTNEFKFRVANVAQSDGSTAVATTIYTDVTARTEESTAADTPAAANIEGTGTYSTDGEGEVITVDVGKEAPQSRTSFSLAFGPYADTLKLSRRWDRPRYNKIK
jgi:hypothetical protein